MKVEIIVARTRYPVVGKVVDIEESQAQYLIDEGLAKLADKKQEKRTAKPAIKEKE